MRRIHDLPIGAARGTERRDIMEVRRLRRSVTAGAPQTAPSQSRLRFGVCVQVDEARLPHLQRRVVAQRPTVLAAALPREGVGPTRGVLRAGAAAGAGGRAERSPGACSQLT